MAEIYFELLHIYFEHLHYKLRIRGLGDYGGFTSIFNNVSVIVGWWEGDYNRRSVQGSTVSVRTDIRLKRTRNPVPVIQVR